MDSENGVVKKLTNRYIEINRESVLMLKNNGVY